MDILERFLKYVKVHTTSSEETLTHPSTKIQFDLANMLVEEMKEMGINNAYVDDKCYVYGKINKNTDGFKSIGLIAHLDTAPVTKGENVNPQIIKSYDGGKICLNKELNMYLDPLEYPELKERVGEDIITTDGTTLLGADDKAGIAEIMQACEIILNDDSIKHGDIYIAFTPDEEIGEGADNFNLKDFKCDYAFTIDGGKENIYEYENFNAASCKVIINGINIHPGSAKGHMINSSLVAMEFNSMLPEFMKPEYTDGYDGFNHLCSINGTVDKTIMEYIIRNHNKEIFKNQKEMFLKIKDFINSKYNKNICEVILNDSYYNMYDIVKDHMDIIEIIKKAIIDSGMTPESLPIRGGTDGARLTYDGLITPNLGTGGANYHGKYEYVSLDAMKKCVNVIINIIKQK